MKTANVIVPGYAVGSDNETEIATAHYDYIPIIPLREDSGVYLEKITYGDESVPYTDEPFVDEVIDQLYDAEAH